MRIAPPFETGHLQFEGVLSVVVAAKQKLFDWLVNERTRTYGRQGVERMNSSVIVQNDGDVPEYS